MVGIKIWCVCGGVESTVEIFPDLGGGGEGVGVGDEQIFDWWGGGLVILASRENPFMCFLVL